MKVNIYYGGRGLVDDPSLFVMDKITTVLEELNIKVNCYKLFEDKQGISVLPKTLREADAVIFTASVEWMGIGGLLWQFFDACFLYGDREKIKHLHMMPVVIATTCGENEALFALTKAWETLGGISCNGICAYVSDTVEFETTVEYSRQIEWITENFYRSFSKKSKPFPRSINAITETVLQPMSMRLTPQESEQLSEYVANDSYVKKQKEDISELTQMFKQMMGDDGGKEKPKKSEKPPEKELTNLYLADFKQAFRPVKNLSVSFSWEIAGAKEKLIIEVDDKSLNCYYGQKEKVDVAFKSERKVLEEVISGKTSAQTAFREGNLVAKGNFSILNMFDTLFDFVSA